MKSLKRLEGKRWFIWALFVIIVGLGGLAAYIYISSVNESSQAVPTLVEHQDNQGKATGTKPVTGGNSSISYRYDEKTLELRPDSQSDTQGSRDLYFVNANGTEEKLLSIPRETSGFGTTSVPSLAYVYGEIPDYSFYSNVFVDMSSGSWLEADLPVGEFGNIRNVQQLAIHSSLSSDAMTIRFKFAGLVSQGSLCMQSGASQEGKQPVKVTGLQEVMGKTTKEYNFAVPEQLTCRDSEDLGSNYKEDFGLSYYAIDPGLSKVGIIAKGTNASGRAWSYLIGFDLKKRSFIPWGVGDKGFTYQQAGS